MNRSFKFSLLIILTCFSDAVLAQDPLTTNQEIKVVVTASRGTEQDPLNVPQAIDQIDRDELNFSEPTDVDDAVRRLPNVGMAPAEGNPNYWQEGFTIRGLGAQRVLTLTDGVRQAGQGIGYGGGNLSLYDTYAIEKIEVLRGPASVLYGTDAFGGVVNIITRNPRERQEFGTNAGARYSFDASRDMNRVGAYLDFGDKPYGVVIGGSYTDAAEPNLPDDEDPKSGSYENWGLWGKSDFQVSDDTSVRLIANYTRNTDILITDDIMPLPIATFPPPGSSELIVSPLFFEIPRYSRLMLGAELNVGNLEGAFDDFKTGVYFQRLEREFHRETAFYSAFSPGFAGPPLFVNPGATVTTSVVDTDDRTDTIEWQTQAGMKVDQHAITVGFDLGFDNTELPETETQQVVGRAGVGAALEPATTIERTRADADQVRMGAYVQDTYKLNDWRFIPGVRLDFYSVDDNESDFDDDEFGVSGSLGTVYNLCGCDEKGSNGQSLYLNLASGFRAPDLGERFQNGIVNLGAPTRIIGQADLDPERAYSAEFGIKARSSNFSYEAATFYSHINDYIGLENLGILEGFATEQYSNVGDVELYGVEFGGSYELTEQLAFLANAGRTWTADRSKVDTADWIFNYGPELSFGVDSDYISQVRFAVLARSVLNSEDKTQSARAAVVTDYPSFTTLDLRATLDLVETSYGRGTINFGVRNLLDKTYFEPFFPMHQPERSVFVAVELQY